MLRHGLILILLGLLSGLIAGEATPETAASASVGAAPAATLDTDPRLAGWWRLDETSGDTAADASGRGRHASVQGGMSLAKSATAGRQGGALTFDGSDACLQVTGYKGVTGTKSRTIAAWIKTASSAGEIIAWGANDFGKMWTFGFIRSRLGVTPKGGYYYMKEATHDDAWHHVAAVLREGSPPNLHDNASLYLDGTQAIVHDIGYLDLWPIETGGELDVRIGRRFKGSIDDLRLYDRALTDEEIQALFKLQTNRPVSDSR